MFNKNAHSNAFFSLFFLKIYGTVLLRVSTFFFLAAKSRASRRNHYNITMTQSQSNINRLCYISYTADEFPIQFWTTLYTASSSDPRVSR